MISAVGWESWGSPESLKMHRFLYIRNAFFGEVGSVGSPESLSMYGFPCIFHNFFGGVGGVESPESSQAIDFDTFFMISSLEWEAWEAQNH